jgi:hypothetical protein
MTPSRAQYFFARLWLVHTWSAGVTLLCVIAAVRASGVTTSSLREWPLVLWLLGIVLVSALIGWFAALLFGWFLFGPLYFARGQKNGAPFRVGDRVHILVGAHRDAVVSVYEVWESRNQVRVELGDDEKKKVRDVFSYYEICRASAA